MKAGSWGGEAAQAEGSSGLEPRPIWGVVVGLEAEAGREVVA